MLYLEYNGVWMWNVEDKWSNEKAPRGSGNVIFTEDDEDLLDKEGNEWKCIDKSPDWKMINEANSEETV